MSLKGYKKNTYKIYKVRCAWTLSDGNYEYIYTSYAKTEPEALQEAKEVVLMGKHPTFRAEAVEVVEY